MYTLFILARSRDNMYMYLVSVAQQFADRVQQLAEFDRGRQLAQVNFKVQSDILATVIERNNRATNFVEALRQVLLLPRPEDVLNVAMVEVEEWFTRAVLRITSLAKLATNTKVAAAVDVALGEICFAFNPIGKLGVVYCVKNHIDGLLIGPEVHQRRDKIALQAVRLRVVDHELVRCERAVLDTATTSAALDAIGVWLAGVVNIFSVTTESGIWLEDLRIEDSC
jgi:hypothetical protein